MKQETCKEKVRGAYKERMAEIRKLWNLYQKDCRAQNEDLGSWDEYGLCFDYVPAGTFGDQKRGYFQYQISYGGPSEQFRFYTNERLNITGCYFWFLDWFDGASIRVTGRNLDLWREIWENFQDMDLLILIMEEAE